MLSKQRIELPWWLTLLIVLETLPMFIGPAVALTRPVMMGGPDAETINQAAFIYSGRNLAVGIALIIAYCLKSAPMLFSLILVRLLTDIVDLPTLLYFGLLSNQTLAVLIFVFIYYIPALAALWFLWMKMTASEPSLKHDRTV